MLRSFTFGVASAFVIVASGHASDFYSSSEPANYPASYKDGPYAPLETWAGFYTGVNGGNAYHQARVVASPGVDPYWGIAGDRIEASADEGFGGAHIGYNFQRGNVVFGVEGAFDGVGASTSVRSPRFPATEAFRIDIASFETLHGRIGYAFFRDLVYLKGGYAAADLTLKGGSIAGASTSQFKCDGAVSGFAIGGGVEHLIGQTWVAGVEYNYLDFGSVSLQAVDTSGRGYRSDASVSAHTVAARLSYKVGSVYEPLK